MVMTRLLGLTARLHPTVAVIPKARYGRMLVDNNGRHWVFILLKSIVPPCDDVIRQGLHVLRLLIQREHHGGGA